MDLTEIYRYAIVAFGIGLVIFVHEAGHFIAARLCKVRVEVFSLGFGPRLLAWTRGTTTYQLALVPLGGYVKMAGEESQGSGLPPAPDELPAKSVGQRFFIYSGGVVMNVVFGLVVFPIILMHGVPFAEPLIGEAVPGGPAWRAGVQPGSRVLAVNDQSVFAFDQVLSDVVLSASDAVRLRVLEPAADDGGTPREREITIQREYDESKGFGLIEVTHAAHPEGRVAVLGEPARSAGIESGDRLLEVVGGLPGDTLLQQLHEAQARGLPIALRLERAGEVYETTLEPREVEVGKKPLLGIQPALTRVRALRPNPALEDLGLREGDRILAVDGRTTVQEHQFRDALLAAAGRPFQVDVVRGERELALTGPALTRDELLRLARDIALEGELASTVVAVTPNGPAARAGLRDGDRLVRIDGTQVETWDAVLDTTRARAREGRPLGLSIERPPRSPDGPSESIDIEAEPSRSLPAYGLSLQPATYVYRADSPVAAVRIGLESTWRFTRDTWETLKGMVLGRVSTENMGGIITISAVSYSWASVGLAKLFFFLCMLSLNLAFLNVLPIPVLDGGHLFFLLIEKLKGSPVSERVLGYSQMVGLVLILSLMIYVTWNDIQRYFPF
jgi:regulator of sigma E protease